MVVAQNILHQITSEEWDLMKESIYSDWSIEHRELSHVRGSLQIKSQQVLNTQSVKCYIIVIQSPHAIKAQGHFHEWLLENNPVL